MTDFALNADPKALVACHPNRPEASLLGIANALVGYTGFRNPTYCKTTRRARKLCSNILLREGSESVFYQRSL